MLVGSSLTTQKSSDIPQHGSWTKPPSRKENNTQWGEVRGNHSHVSPPGSHAQHHRRHGLGPAGKGGAGRWAGKLSVRVTKVSDTLKKCFQKSATWKCLDLPDHSTKLLVRSQRLKSKRNPKLTFSAESRNSPLSEPWLDAGPCPYQAQAEQGEQQEQAGTLGGRHGRGSAGVVTLPVTLPHLLPAFKLGGGTGAPPPKACGTRRTLGKSRLLLGGETCQTWGGGGSPAPGAVSLHPLARRQLPLPVPGGTVISNRI